MRSQRLLSKICNPNIQNLSILVKTPAVHAGNFTVYYFIFYAVLYLEPSSSWSRCALGTRLVFDAAIVIPARAHYIVHIL